MKQKILVADDEECVRYTFYDFLTGGGYDVETTDTLPGCMKKIEEKPFDLLFLDIGLGRDNGLDAIERIKVIQPNCEVVIITGSLNSAAINRARKCGALDYVVKPIRETSLNYITKKALIHSASLN